MLDIIFVANETKGLLKRGRGRVKM